jgi:feruloyl esterase
MRFRLFSSIAPLMLVVIPAHAATTCTVDALNALSITDLKVTEAKAMPASAQMPAFCQVTGTVITRGEGAPEGSARFLMQLPEVWKQRFIFYGVGGNAGTLSPSANGIDRNEALGKGYVTVLTDTGHAGDGTAAKWARKPDNSLDQAKVTDFFYRAVHDVTVAGKAFAQSYYGSAVVHAYFDGCSTGGRIALAEADHYPGDFAGVIAGDPAMDFKLNLARTAVQNVTLLHKDAFIPESLLKAIDARVTDQCDAIDGAKDGIVQDPTRCPVHAEDLLCKPGENQACLNVDQVAVLIRYTGGLRDEKGSLVYPGWSLTDLSGNAFSNYTAGKTPANLSNPAAPWDDRQNAPRGWEMAHESLAYYLGEGANADLTKVEIDPGTGRAGDALLARVDKAMSSGEGDDPKKLKPFIAGGGKVILYHGASDQSIPSERTVMFYRDLVAMLGGSQKTEESVRLFLVPGMHHCAGGVGPDQFDTLTALEDWVEQGHAPASILATTRPNAAVQHRVPLCPYPQQARYIGKGDLADEKNWSCKAPVDR